MLKDDNEPGQSSYFIYTTVSALYELTCWTRQLKNDNQNMQQFQVTKFNGHLNNINSNWK